MACMNMWGLTPFQKCGIIYVIEDNYPRYAYEKVK